MRSFLFTRAHRRRVIGVALAVAVSSVAAVLGLAPAAHAAEFDVDCNVDELIATIEATEDDDPDVADVINLEEDCTYVLTDVAVGNTSAGLPLITETLTINGNGATIRRSSKADTPEFRIFEIAEDGDLTLNDLTVKGGRAAPNPVVFLGPLAQAGGIVNSGVLTGNGLRVTRNTVEFISGEEFSTIDVILAGGILNHGTMVLNDSRVDHNRVSAACPFPFDPPENQGGEGTGCFSHAALAGGIGNIGSATVDGSRVDRNSARAFGGANAVAIGGGIASGDLRDFGEVAELEVHHSRVEENAAAAFAEEPRPGGAGLSLAFAAGGGIAVNTDDTVTDATVTNTRMSNNSVLASGTFGSTTTGGGFFQGGASTVVLHSDRIHRNRAEADAPPGASALGGGFSQLGIDRDSHTAIVDTVVTRNLAESEQGIARGGGIYIEDTAELVGGRVERNAAKGVLQQGGGIFSLGTVNITGTDVEGNAPHNCFGNFTGDIC